MLIESMGAVVTRSADDAVGIDAYSRWSGGRPIIVLTVDKQDAARSNFDAAHELGHLVMHPDAEPGSAIVEHQAQAFASALLMPASSIRPELPQRFELSAYEFGFKVVTITLRGDTSVLRNSWTAIAYADGQIIDDRTYEIELVDRIGGGDAYSAGFIYGVLTGDVAKGVAYGNAYSALKQTSWGDLNYATLGEAQAQLQGAGSRIVR